MEKDIFVKILFVGWIVNPCAKGRDIEPRIEGTRIHVVDG